MGGKARDLKEKRMRTNLRAILELTCILLTICMLAGCGGGKDNADASLPTETTQDRKDKGAEKPAEGDRAQIVLSVFTVLRQLDETGAELPSNMERLIEEFNAGNSRYEVVLRAGMDEGIEYGDYYNRLNTELIGGDGPDLFCANLNANFPVFVRKNVIEDLKPFMDRDLEDEDYLKNILYAYEKEGKVYGLQYSFTLFPYIMDADLSGGRETLDFREVKRILEENPNLSSYNGQEAMSVLQECCIRWSWDPSDMELLREYILFAEEYGVQINGGEAVPGRNCLTSQLQLSQADGLNRYFRYGDSGGRKFDMLFSVGGPASCRQEGTAFSINAASKQKEGAWEFIKFALSKEIQEKIQPYRLSSVGTGEYHDGFPVRKEQFEQLLQESAKPIECTDQQKESMGYSKDALISGLGTECLTEKEVSLIRKLVEYSDGAIWEDYSTPWEIVSSEVQSYYNHTKTLEECLSVIENRMSLYLLEQ